MPGDTHKRYPSELQERAVRMAAEIADDQGSEWAAMTRVAELLEVGMPETVRKWVRQAQGLCWCDRRGVCDGCDPRG